MYFMHSQGATLFRHPWGGGVCKKTAWVTWQSYPEATVSFENLLLLQDGISDQTMSTLEQFVVLLYDKKSDSIKVNDCKKQLFTRKSRILDNLPPTKAAPQQHVKRGTYQAICWTQALNADPKLPSPENLGWKIDSVTGWQPFWTKLPEASQS